MNTASLSSVLTRADSAPKYDVFGVTVAVLLDGPATQGSHAVYHVTCPPGAGAPVHRHAQAENFYVIEGRFSIRSGEETLTLGPGDFAHVPGGVVHDFRNSGTTSGVLIGMGTPAGHETFFREADELARSGRFNPDTAAELCQRNGIELLT